MPANSSKSAEDKQGWVARDFFASMVVFLVALPLCMGIAVASGVPVSSGLMTGIIGGLAVGPVSGAPLQVSGPAAGLTPIIYEAVQQHGFAALGLIVLMAGAIQLVAGLCKLGQWFRAVSPAVIHGMLAGIGVLIFASQFHVMVDDKPRHGGFENLRSIPEAVAKGLPWPQLGSSGERHAKLLFLQEFGKLHERQVELQTAAGNLASIHGTAAEHQEQGEALAPLAEQQAELTADLQTLGEEVAVSELGAKKNSAMEAALASAVAKSTQAADDLREGRAEAVLSSQAAAADSLAEVRARFKNHDWAAKLGILTIAIIVGWQLLIPKRFQIAPGPLVAIVVVTALAALFQLPVLYVELPERIVDGIHFPSLTTLNDMPLYSLFVTAVMIAIIASAETLLCATAVDQMHQGPRTRYDRELAAQGIGNMLCGLVGALPMTGVIVRSAANVQAGATSRLSATLHGVWLLLFVAFLGTSLRYIPTSALAGILVYTGYKLINPKQIAHLWKVGRMEAAIYAIVVAIIVFEDLLMGVLAGVVLSAVKLLWDFSRLDARLEIDRQKARADLRLSGAATFLRLPRLAATLESVPEQAHLHVDMRQLAYIDHACMELLMNWAKQHELTGGRLYIDWDSLHARFSHAAMPQSGEVHEPVVRKKESVPV